MCHIMLAGGESNPHQNDSVWKVSPKTSLRVTSRLNMFGHLGRLRGFIPLVTCRGYWMADA